MTKKKSTSAPQVINTPTPQTAGGTSASALKERFQARSIPLETDFADLIDMAECGQRAVGHAYGQTSDPASGLVLNEQEQLKVLVAPESGIVMDSEGIGILTKPDAGVVIDDTGMGINIGSGLTITNNQLSVNYSRPGFSITKHITEKGWYRLFGVAFYDNDKFSTVLITARTASSKQVFTLSLYTDGSPNNSPGHIYAVTVSNASAEANAPIELVRLSVKGGGYDDSFIELKLGALNTDITITVSYSPFDANIAPIQLSAGGGSPVKAISATTNGSMNESSDSGISPT